MDNEELAPEEEREEHQRLCGEVLRAGVDLLRDRAEEDAAA